MILFVLSRYRESKIRFPVFLTHNTSLAMFITTLKQLWFTSRCCESETRFPGFFLILLSTLPRFIVTLARLFLKGIKKKPGFSKESRSICFSSQGTRRVRRRRQLLRVFSWHLQQLLCQQRRGLWHQRFRPWSWLQLNQGWSGRG